jgi:hypothetical protein
VSAYWINPRNQKQQWAGRVAQGIEHLPSKREYKPQYHHHKKKKKKKKKKEVLIPKDRRCWL